MSACPACAEFSPRVREIRKSLKSVAVRPVPPDLNMKLRVAASREASRKRRMLAGSGVWSLWMEDFRLLINNLMRPLAIPTAGGFASALLLFSMLAPGLTMHGVSATPDVPTGLYTEASVKSYLPLVFEGDDLVIELTVNDQGRMIDYTIANPRMHEQTEQLRRRIEHHLLTMQFQPATSFGQPTSGKVRLWFRNSRIDVRG